MKLTFWGVRGSISSPLSNAELKQKLTTALKLFIESPYAQSRDIEGFLPTLPFATGSTHGGNTPCVELESHGETVILDAGTGLRPLGLDLLKRKPASGIIHLFVSHTHWDHICGFPFFAQAFDPSITIRFYSPFSDLQKRFEYQQKFDFFPVSLDFMQAKKEFILLKENEPVTIGKDLKINFFIQHHPGISYAYSFRDKTGKAVYSTDNEMFNADMEYVNAYKDFIRDADILVFDAQYTLSESFNKTTFGHSSPTFGVELALNAGIRNLILFHYDPLYSDEQISNNLRTAVDYYNLVNTEMKKYADKKLKVYSAFEGFSLEI
jgi:phosphoribosyl 1,2-cyclic phosphodiesterase